MSKKPRPNVRGQVHQPPPQIQGNFALEFDYKVWVVHYQKKAAEIERITTEASKYLSEKSMMGWTVTPPTQYCTEDSIILSAMLTRPKERKIIAPVGLG